eukprot:SAG31_NODE_550_length_14214_cov_3.054269_9_plen_97_part_00
MRPLACSLRASVLALAAASACSSLSPLLDSAYASPAGGSAAQASAAAAGGEIENAAALPRAFVDCSRGSDTNSGILYCIGWFTNIVTVYCDSLSSL